MTAGTLKTCYITAPLATDTESLCRALEDRGVHWYDIVSIEPGLSTLGTIESAIATADFVCAVIPARSDLSAVSSVILEMGVALGGHRPLLVFIEPGVKLSSTFQNLSYARTTLADHEAVAFHLDAFLEHAGSSPRRPSSPAPRPRPIDTSWVAQALNSLDPPGRQGSGRTFERLIARLLEQAGAVVSEAPTPLDRGVDMALWIDELASSLGNPVLVETKYGRLSSRRLDEAEARLRMHMAEINATAGLLIYLDTAGSRLSPSAKGWPLVIRMPASELIDLVSRGQLVSALLHRRNQAVHGIR